MNNPINICACGAEAGYPHDEACPFPYFGRDEDKIAEWEAAREQLNPITPEGIEIGAQLEFFSVKEPVDEVDAQAEAVGDVE